MVELQTFRLNPELKNNPHNFEFRALKPEFPTDFSIGRAADIVTLEAYNPNETSHDAMKPDELVAWMQGDAHNRTRFVKVDPDKFFEHVDKKTFNHAIEEARETKDFDLANSLETMRDNGVLGFVYMYNHEYRGKDDAYRAGEIRNKLKLSKEKAIWEINTGFVPGAKDVPVEYAVDKTLTEFTQETADDSIGIYFADAGDMKESFLDTLKRKARVTLEQIASSTRKLTDATDNYQDARVLSRFGFKLVDRIRYLKGQKAKDFVFGIVLHGQNTAAV